MDDLDLLLTARIGRRAVAAARSTCLMEIKIRGHHAPVAGRGLLEREQLSSRLHFSKYGAAYQTMLREDRSPQFGSETIHLNEKGEIYCA